MSRPLNQCAECGYTWHPRGRNLSRRCPNCGVVFTSWRDDRTKPSAGGWSAIAVLAFTTPFLFCCGCLALFSGIGRQPTNEVRNQNPAVEPRPPVKEAPKLPGLGEWVKSGDVRIVIDHAVVGSPVILTAKDGETKGPESLMVWYAVESTTAKPFSYRRPTENVVAIDDRGSALEYRTGGGVVIKDDVAFAKLTPEKPQVADVMIFAPPADDADAVEITIPAVSRDQSGTFRFRITSWEGKVNRSKTKPEPEVEAAESVVQATSPADPPAVPGEPKPNGTAPPASVRIPPQGALTPIPSGGKTVFVHSYYRKDGTFVRQHYRSPPRRR